MFVKASKCVYNVSSNPDSKVVNVYCNDEGNCLEVLKVGMS